MRIGIDARELAGHPTGVGRYLGQIVKAWGRNAAAHDHAFVFFAPDTIQLPDAAALTMRLDVVPGHGIWWEQVALPRAARRAGVDVLFAPGYSGPVVGP